MGGDHNTMIVVTADEDIHWPRLSKIAAAEKLAGKIAKALTE